MHAGLNTNNRDVFEDNMVEAKAKAKATKFCPRGVLEVEASPRGPPYLGFFFTARYAESGYAKSSLCPSDHHSQIQRPTAASCALVYEVLYVWYCVLYLLTILKNLTSYEAKVKASHHRGQGHKILSSRSRPVLEDPIPVKRWFGELACMIKELVMVHG